MAQPAVTVFGDRTDFLGVPVIWHKPTSPPPPPRSWDSWIEQINLASTLWERCDPRGLLKPSGVVHDDPAPKLEAVGPKEDATATVNRLPRDAAAVRRVEDTTEERSAKGPKIALGVYFHEADQRIKSRLFFLELKGRKRFLQSYPHVDLSTFPFKKLYDYCVLLFKKEKHFTIKRLQIYNSVHSERCYLNVSVWTKTLEKEVVRDIFIVKMLFEDIQRELCIRAGSTPEEI